MDRPTRLTSRSCFPDPGISLLDVTHSRLPAETDLSDLEGVIASSSAPRYPEALLPAMAKVALPTATKRAALEVQSRALEVTCLPSPMPRPCPATARGQVSVVWLRPL